VNELHHSPNTPFATLENGTELLLRNWGLDMRFFKQKGNIKAALIPKINGGTFR
jgi:hypothetical protein